MVSRKLVNEAYWLVKNLKWTALRHDEMGIRELFEGVLIQINNPTVGIRLKKCRKCCVN